MKIAICGSMATQTFLDGMIAAKKEIERQGHEVLIPLVEEGTSAYENLSENEAGQVKNRYTLTHFEKIAQSDAVLVLNPKKRNTEGYIGANTIMELAVALYLGKKIYILNKVSRELPAWEEVMGTLPIFLDGDLGKI